MVWRRRWNRFTLRALLIGVAAVCLLLAIARPFLGMPGAWRWAGVVSQRDGLGRTVSLRLCPPESALEWLGSLGEMPALERLTVYGGAFSDEHLATVGQLPHLRLLTLYGSGVTPEAVASLASQRPELEITAEPLEITFHDLAFPTPQLQPFSPSALTPRIRGIAGGRVTLRGHMNPPAKQYAQEFTLLARVRYECVDGPYPPCELIEVRLRPGSAIRFTTWPVEVTGVLTVDSSAFGSVIGINPGDVVYRMTDCVAQTITP